MSTMRIIIDNQVEHLLPENSSDAYILLHPGLILHWKTINNGQQGSKDGNKGKSITKHYFLAAWDNFEFSTPTPPIVFVEKDRPKITYKLPGTMYKHTQILGSLYVCANLLKFQEACTYPYKLLKTSVTLYVCTNFNGRINLLWHIHF